MDYARPIFRWLRYSLACFLVGYWVIFIGYTVKNFVTGGPSAVVAWYKHISQRPFEPQWSWGVFWASQAAILLITFAVCFFGRLSRHRR